MDYICFGNRYVISSSLSVNNDISFAICYHSKALATFAFLSVRQILHLSSTLISACDVSFSVRQKVNLHSCGVLIVFYPSYE